MPLKISLELSEANPKEIDALVCFLTVCGGGKSEEPAPESAFSVEPEADWGPHLVPNPSNAPETASAPVTGASSAGSVVPVTDKSGLPWDERIHASTRTLTADGFWRKKRGIDEGSVTTVETQLRQVMAIPSPSAAPAPPAAAVTPPPPPPPPAAPGADFQNQFVALIGRTAQALAAGKITQAQIQQCANSAGLPNIQMLFNRPDLFEQVRAAVDAIIGV